MAPGATVGGDGAGVLLDRLELAGGETVCSINVPAGAPLLAVPLASCWTAESAKKCKAVAQALITASNRNPRLELLQSDTTWIALHLLYEKKQGDKAPQRCREHLALLPEAPETLLAWSTMDLAGLQGSHWRKEVVRRKADLEADYDTLIEELGLPDAVALGLDEQGYTWARQILLQMGVQVLAHDGRPTTLLAPGLHRLRPDTSTAPSADSLRLEFGQDGASPMLVLSASRSYKKGEYVGLTHAALACANGCRLLGCGWPLRPNPWDFVEVTLELGCDERSRPVLEDLAAALDWSDGFPPLAPGDCVTADAIDDWAPMSAVPGSSTGRVQVKLRLTREQPLPGGKTLMAMLGTAMLGDASLLHKVMKDEKDQTDVLGQDTCERRALLWLKERLTAMLQEFPKAPAVVQGTASRLARAGRVAADERETISLALSAIEDRLKSPLPAEDLVAAKGLGVRPPSAALSTAEEPDPHSQVGEALTRLRGCSQQLSDLASRFESLCHMGKLAREDGQLLQSELEVLRSCLRGSRLGDPGVASSVPSQPHADPTLRVHGEATAALLEAVRAAQEWEIAGLERAAKDLAPCAEPPAGDPRRLLAETLMAKAGVEIRRLDFAAAHADLQRSLKHVPNSNDAKVMARDCAVSSAARSERVLAETSWSGCEAALKDMRTRLKALGYFDLNPALPPRTELPLHTILEQMWTEDVQKRMLDAAGEDSRSGKLTDVVRLLLLRRPLPLRRAVELLGKEAVYLMLSRSAFSCYRFDQAVLLTETEAAKAVQDPSSSTAADAEVFSNVAIWPLSEGVLVAADFERGLPIEGAGAFEPVPYPAEDTGALIAGARDRQFAESVLHVCCGCGAEGLVAIQHYAKKVTFLESSTRALSFVRFAVHLNGFEEQATFVKGSLAAPGMPSGLSAPFDAVLLCSSFLPNPDSLASSFGPMYLHGGPRGDAMLQNLVGRCARRLLNKGGWLLATAMVPDAEGLQKHVASWADAALASGPADFRAVVLCGAPEPSEELMLSLLQDRSELEQQRYLGGLREVDVRTISEVVVALALCPEEVATRRDLRVEVQQRSRTIWSDSSWSPVEAHGILQKLLGTLHVGKLIAEGPAKSPLYTLSWSPETAGDERSVTIEAPAEITPGAPSASPWRRLKSLQQTERPLANVDGCTWSEVVSIQSLGYTLPVLCDVFWAETPKPEVRDQLPKDHVALLEIKGCRLPAGMEKALRRNLQATTRYTFDGKPRKFQVAAGGSFAGYGGPLEDTDVLVVPLLPGVYSDAPFDALPTELVLLLQAVNDTIEREQRYVTVVIVTSGSSGPVMSSSAEKPSAAGPIQGLARVARTEFPLLPLICIDTDAFGTGGDALQLAMQVSCELEATDGTMEVAYRRGKRFAPRVKLSSRNSIRAGCKPPSISWADEGGCVLITGGLGGLGVVTAEVLAEAGARKFILVSRSGQIARDGQGLEDRLRNLVARGAQVILENCDTSSEKQVQALTEMVRSNHGPLQVVIHAAGVLDDKMFIRQDAESMRKTFAPKADGAWFLHKHTQADKLKMFCCFSSIAGLIGNGGQANYAAANTAMDELCKWRAAKGLPSISLQLPGIAEVGMAAAMDKKSALQNDYTIQLPTLQQVLKQVVAGTTPVEPVQVVATIGMVRPVARQQASMMEMLLAPFIDRLKVEDGAITLSD